MLKILRSIFSGNDNQIYNSYFTIVEQLQTNNDLISNIVVNVKPKFELFLCSELVEFVEEVSYVPHIEVLIQSGKPELICEEPITYVVKNLDTDFESEIINNFKNG